MGRLTAVVYLQYSLSVYKQESGCREVPAAAEGIITTNLSPQARSIACFHRHSHQFHNEESSPRLRDSSFSALLSGPNEETTYFAKHFSLATQ